MERLTYKQPDYDVCTIHCAKSCRGGDCGDCEELGKIINRLAAYEDTGLTPEEIPTAVEMTKIYSLIDEYAKYNASDIPISRIYELIKADKAGRVLELPCKVGDTVYWVHNKTITRCRMYRIQKNRKGIFICLRGDGKSYGAFQADLTIGKTIFLTREEAEEALRGTGNG